MTISVIIPVYNASAFLKKAVNSALQFEEVKEILLLEDCSTDDSLEICRKLAAGNSKIKLIQTMTDIINIETALNQNAISINYIQGEHND